MAPVFVVSVPTVSKIRIGSNKWLGSRQVIASLAATVTISIWPGYQSWFNIILGSIHHRIGAGSILDCWQFQSCSTSSGVGQQNQCVSSILTTFVDAVSTLRR